VKVQKSSSHYRTTSSKWIWKFDLIITLSISILELELMGRVGKKSNFRFPHQLILQYFRWVNLKSIQSNSIHLIGNTIMDIRISVDLCGTGRIRIKIEIQSNPDLVKVQDPRDQNYRSKPKITALIHPLRPVRHSTPCPHGFWIPINPDRSRE